MVTDIRLSDAELRRYRQLAYAAGMNFSQFIRAVVGQYTPAVHTRQGFTYLLPVPKIDRLQGDVSERRSSAMVPLPMQRKDGRGEDQVMGEVGLAQLGEHARGCGCRLLACPSAVRTRERS